VDGADPGVVEGALAAAGEALARRKTPSGSDARGGAEPATLDAALRAQPGANLAVISLPGAYAAREAHRALDHGLHVMLFSDNVPLADEIALKTVARSRGLLVMGPDCGTAIVNGKPLCFANVVRRGPVGIVAASGTGLQEVSALVDRGGSGVSQALGTGGRDLKDDRVGGISMLMGIEALARDEATRVIVVISKPPAPAVAAKVVAALEAAGKNAVVHFVGLASPPAPASALVRYAANLEEAAGMAVEMAGGRPWTGRTFDLPDAVIEALVARETAGMATFQRFARGYFTGGTLADEAWILLHRLTGAVHSNNQTNPDFVLADPRVSLGHTVVDLGDDAFTVGRPHPMIDPGIRTERIDAEASDPSVAVMLVDVVLGYGSHPDPAGALVPSLAGAKRSAAARGGRLAVVASVTGTPGDYQGFAGQKAKLEAAGVVVMPSNAQASMLVATILQAVSATAGGGR
jgi:FdrA protein